MPSAKNTRQQTRTPRRRPLAAKAATPTREVKARTEQLMGARIEFVGNDRFENVDAERKDISKFESSHDEHSENDIRKTPKGLPAYLASLYTTTLLTKEQEAFLFRKMNFLKFQCAKLRSELDAEHPDPKQIAKIEKLLVEAKTIRNQIIQCNLRLVVSIAKQYVDSSSTFDELVSDGNESLIRAVEKFDFARGYRFSTYATWAIRRNFFRQIADKRKRRTRFVSAEEETLDGECDTPAYHELTEKEYLMLRKSIGHVLHRLNPREQKILNLRFGLADDEQAHTLQQIGRELGVSKERVRQIEGRALAKLRGFLELEPPDALNKIKERFAQ